MKIAVSLAAASLALSGGAFAQDAPATSQPNAPPAAKSADISDEQVERFALVALKVQQVAADSTLDEQQKQAIMVAAAQQSDMGPEEFNTILAASRTDKQLQQRIRAAAMAHVEAARSSEGPQENP